MTRFKEVLHCFDNGVFDGVPVVSVEQTREAIWTGGLCGSQLKAVAEDTEFAAWHL